MRIVGANEINIMQFYSEAYSASYDKSASHDHHDASVHDKG